MARNILYKINMLLALCLILLSNGVCHATSSAGKEAPPSKITWQSWSNAPFQQAKAQNRLVLIEIKAEWCHWCNLMNDITFKDKDVIKLINSSYVPVRLDVDKDLNIVRQFKATSLPTILILNANHKIIKQFSGYISPSDFINKLKFNSQDKTLSSQKVIKTHITIIGEKKNFLTLSLYKAARVYQSKGIGIEVLQKGEKSKKYPEIHFPLLNKPAAYICSQNRCSIPIFTPKMLSDHIEDIIYPQQIENQFVVTLDTPTNKNDLHSNNEKNEYSHLLNKNNLVTLIGFWLIGVLLAFTPCILPLLIIIASFIGGNSGSTTQRKSIYLALVYVLSLATTYSIAGLISSIFGFYLQGYFQHTWIKASFSFIFVLLALSLLGFYRLALPQKWQHYILKFNKYHDSYDYSKIIIMGVLATLIASPCAAAPLLAVISYVGISGNVILGSLSLFFIGLGVGTPLLIGTIIGTSILPKSPVLLEGIERFFGLALMSIAIWLLNRIIPAWVSMFMWGALAMYPAIIVMRIHTNSNAPGWKILNLLSYLLFLYGIAILISTLYGSVNPLNLSQNKESLNISQPYNNSTFTYINKLAEINRIIESAKLAHKPVLLNFYASWCSICRNQNKVFIDPVMRNLLQKFIVLRIDITDERTIDIALKFNVIAVPETVFINSRGQRFIMRLPDALTTEVLRTVLEKVLNNNQ